jgi:hypothetical protein
VQTVVAEPRADLASSRHRTDIEGERDVARCEPAGPSPTIDVTQPFAPRPAGAFADLVAAAPVP